MRGTVIYDIILSRVRPLKTARASIHALAAILLAGAVYPGSCVAEAGSPASFSAPCSSGYNLYVGNLHSHTSYSDGAGTPAEAFQYARDVAGIDFLAVTDHHQQLSPQEYADILFQADVFTEDGVFVGIGGQEWSGYYNNHCTVWDAPYVLKAPQANYDSLYREIAGLGCTAAFCHPKPHNFGYFAYSAVGDLGINAVEVRDEQEEERYIDILNKGWHVGTDGSQDNHSANWGDGWSWTVAVACSLTRECILDATRNHRTYSTLERDLQMIFMAEGHYMGAEFAHADNIEFSIDVHDPEPWDHFRRLELYQDGLMIAWAWVDTASYTWNPVVTPTNGENHYFVKVHQEPGRYAWSAPIWIDCTTTLPSTPRPVSPYDRQIVTTLTPTFAWHASEGAETYVLQCSASETFPLDSSTMTISGISDTVCALPFTLEDDVWYYWHVMALNESGGSTYSGVYRFITDEDASSAPGTGASLTAFERFGASPNPFTGRISIEFALLRSLHVELVVYDARGQRVRILVDERKDCGRHEVTWDGTDSSGRRLSPGVYLCRLRADGRGAIRKLVIVK
jgi:hypothetical protein